MNHEILRIFFDDSPVPQVERPPATFRPAAREPVDINTPLLSVQQWSGYNAYFEMPFAKKARIEFETAGDGIAIYLQVDWQRYPDQEMRETKRFCASWRREMPTQSYGEDFLMLDADGPGQLIGFVYGVRLIDNVDRWSHGGAENISIDGLGDQPAYVRGMAERTRSASYGGAASAESIWGRCPTTCTRHRRSARGPTVTGIASSCRSDQVAWSPSTCASAPWRMTCAP